MHSRRNDWLQDCCCGAISVYHCGPPTGEPERLIPFVIGPIVQSVDLKAGRIVVEWSPDW